MAEAHGDQRLAEWLRRRQLDHLIPTLREWGCSEPQDLTHLYASDIEQLGLKLAKARKLWRDIRRLADGSSQNADAAGVEHQQQAADSSSRVEAQPYQEPHAEAASGVDAEMFIESIRLLEAHRTALGFVPHSTSTASAPQLFRAGFASKQAQNGAEDTNVASAEQKRNHLLLMELEPWSGAPPQPAAVHRAVRSGWSAVVADSSLRPRLLPLLFDIARLAPRAPGSTGQTAALALVFLAFSRTGTEVLVRDPLPDVSHEKRCGPAAGTIVMLGWLGSATGDFCDVDAYYAASHPTWRTVITVGGNDRWAKAAAAAEPWPAEEQCAKQLRRLSAELGLGRSHGTTRNNAVTGPIVMHLFSNNGIMLYSRLLAHLGDLGTAGAAVINRIRGVIFDSTPDPSYDPQLLKQVCVASVASVVKVESPPGIQLTDLGLRKPLRDQLYRALEEAADATFDSCWLYDELRDREPACPAVFIYGIVDRTIRQSKIEKWIAECRKAAANRDIKQVVTDGCGHVEHFWKDRKRYCDAVVELLARCN